MEKGAVAPPKSARRLAMQGAKAALTLAAPEVAVPLEALTGIAGRGRQALGGLRVRSPPYPVAENALVAPSRPLLQLRKARVRTMKGVRVYEPASGLSGTEVIAAVTIGGAAYGMYLAAKALQKDIEAIKNVVPKTPKLPWGL